MPNIHCISKHVFFRGGNRSLQISTKRLFIVACGYHGDDVAYVRMISNEYDVLVANVLYLQYTYVDTPNPRQSDGVTEWSRI
jgi:hypothetical protein